MTEPIFSEDGYITEKVSSAIQEAAYVFVDTLNELVIEYKPSILELSRLLTYSIIELRTAFKAFYKRYKRSQENDMVHERPTLRSPEHPEIQQPEIPLYRGP